jgi:hypothetical protein
MGESSHSFSTSERRTAADRLGQVPFQAHVELLQWFLAHRDEIVERIQELLNAQRKPIQYLQDEPLLSRHFEDCFFTLAGVTRDQSRLRGQLKEAHWASGFKPREMPGQHNDLFDPAEMMVRGFHFWRQTHWPGHSGRVRYAHTLFNLHVIRHLALLIMRLWDAGAPGAPDRLSQIQSVLDHLWKTTPSDHPVLVRDARWLIPVAQSPTTNELAGYFEVAEQIEETLSEGNRIEILKAGVRMAGGHLRSQLRHVSMKKGVSLDENSLVLSTRKSNALDLALLIQGLVPLLEAYEQAMQNGNDGQRLDFADSIFQGISPDPELFLNRLDLLGPYSMIEHLFITDHDGHAVYTPMGQRHVQLLREYEARIRRLSKPLFDDCHHFRPVVGTYSPYGVLYGFSSNLFEHMALKTIQLDAVTRFSLEDVFTDGESDKLAWVSGWRRLPHIKPEMAKLFEYPQQFAEDIFARIEQELRRRVSDAEANAAAQTGRLFILPDDDLQADSPAHSKVSQIPDLPAKYIRPADVHDETQLLHERQEGEFVLSYKTSGGWVAVSKDILTEVLGAGHDVKIAGLPRAAAEELKLMCPNLVILPDSWLEPRR